MTTIIDHSDGFKLGTGDRDNDFAVDATTGTITIAGPRFYQPDTVDPTSPTPVSGDRYYNTTDKIWHWYDGTVWMTPSTADSDSIVKVFSASDLPATITAPDGETRHPLVLGKNYKFQTTMVLPKLLIPTAISPTDFTATSISTSHLNVTLLFDGDDKAHIWGRDIGPFAMQDVQLVDISNAGAGRGTNLFDLVGGTEISFISLDFMTFFKFKKMGNLVDIAFQIDGILIEDPLIGFVSRINSGQDISHHVIGMRISQTDTGPGPADKPQLCFQGPLTTATIGLCNINQGSSDSAFCVDSAATGSYDFTGNSYGGVASGGFFFLPDVSQSLTAFANADIAITSFSDSTEDPGVDTTVNFASQPGFTRGQTILIGDEAAYDGLHQIVRVAADELSFDINVVHSTSAAGTLKVTRVTTSGTHPLVDGQTNTISGTTSYNGTTEILFAVSATFDIPVAFVADDATGTVVSSSKTQAIVGVNAQSNGALPNSVVTAEVSLTDNGATTAIPAAGALVEINVDTTYVSNGSERLTVNSTTGVTTVDALSAVKLKFDGNYHVEPTTSTKTLSVRSVIVHPVATTVTFTNGTNLVNETGTTLVDGDLISFRNAAGTLPAELRNDIVYSVVSQATNSFQLSYTAGGAAIAFTDDGTPVNSYQLAKIDGSIPRNQIASASPRDLIPQALVAATLDSEMFVVVCNNDDAVDINVIHCYSRYSQ